MLFCLFSNRTQSERQNKQKKMQNKGRIFFSLKKAYTNMIKEAVKKEYSVSFYLNCEQQNERERERKKRMRG